jgi:hypothetical protein
LQDRNSIVACRDNGELGDGAEDLEEHPADCCARVDALVEYNQFDAAGLELLGQLDQVRQGASEPVEFGDDDTVALPRDQQRLCRAQGGGRAFRMIYGCNNWLVYFDPRLSTFSQA